MAEGALTGVGTDRWAVRSEKTARPAVAPYQPYPAVILPRFTHTQMDLWKSFAIIGLVGLALGFGGCASLLTDYKGKPFEDSVYKAGPQGIPGRVQCAYFDLGGEGVAYHSVDGINHGSQLNRRPEQQRPHANPYIWYFRANEGVSICYVKDIFDLTHKHPAPFSPEKNQLYIGWTKNGEWCNYTVKVKAAGTYKVSVVYACDPATFKLYINHKLAGEYKLPIMTGGMHTWNKAEVGAITFPRAGLQLLTFEYNIGDNFAYFDFE